MTVFTDGRRMVDVGLWMRAGATGCRIDLSDAHYAPMMRLDDNVNVSDGDRYPYGPLLCGHGLDENAIVLRVTDVGAVVTRARRNAAPDVEVRVTDLMPETANPRLDADARRVLAEDAHTLMLHDFAWFPHAGDLTDRGAYDRLMDWYRRLSYKPQARSIIEHSVRYAGLFDDEKRLAVRWVGERLFYPNGILDVRLIWELLEASMVPDSWPMVRPLNGSR